MKSGIEIGRSGGPRVPHEGVSVCIRATVELPIGVVVLRVGRQEQQFGSSRLVSVRDLNVRQSFDAVRATVTRGAWQLDVFTSWPVTTRKGALDDATDRARKLWGVYALRQPGRSRNAADIY
jgi:Alginate export